jgi:cobalt-zinc-cadmium efflux system membrane fusion protein
VNLALRLLPLVALACRPGAPVPAEPPPSVAPSAAARWIASRPADDTALLEAPARVLPSPDAVGSIAPPLTARIVRVRVKPGQRVAANEPLVDVLMPELLHAAGDLAGEEIKVAAYSKRRAQLEALRGEGLARLAELAEVDSQLATARADAQAARATLRAAGMSDAQAAALLSGDGVSSLKAPFRGLVTTLDAYPGQVREPSGAPLAIIVGTGDGRVEARLPSAPSDGGAFAFVSGGEAVPLELVSISPRYEPADGTRLAWFSAVDGGALPIGATGRVRQHADPSWRVVPARAVLEGPSPRVRVRRGSGAALVEVRVIARSGAEAIVSGLDPAEQVAADAAEGP